MRDPIKLKTLDTRSPSSFPSPLQPSAFSLQSVYTFWKEGEPFVWLTATALSLTLLFILCLFGVVLTNGLPVFWLDPIVQLELKDHSKILGEIQKRQAIPNKEKFRIQLKIGNRDLYGLDFRWFDEENIEKVTYPKDAVLLERQEYGVFYGFLKEVKVPHISGDSLFERLEKALEQMHQKKENSQATVVLEDAEGRIKTMELSKILRAYTPNQMSVWEKIVCYASHVRELLFDNPRESNTEGGLFPTIFGTVMIIFLMSIFSFPLGVLAGIYLCEYAKEGFWVRFVRIAVNNLAGIPSIVYGIFGLTFFIYGMGQNIDQWFFAERLPTPTFGTGGILWAALTLALLTVPVVIVNTEEALRVIPRSVREGSLALGATRFQTLFRLLIPMASPGILTGFILAMARAAGEVAPLMITGVVKLAPTLPLDGTFPYLHMDRKFMHLGFHIFDIAFQSPNIEASRPFIFVTTILLLVVVILMSSTAIYLRNKLRERYVSKGTF
jgi:phosphate transport system permease protein